MCIFESDTVKSDCPMQENYEIFKDLIQTVGLITLLVLLFVLEIYVFFKKSSENDLSQLVISRAFFLVL